MWPPLFLLSLLITSLPLISTPSSSAEIDPEFVVPEEEYQAIYKQACQALDKLQIITKQAKKQRLPDDFYYQLERAQTIGSFFHYQPLPNPHATKTVAHINPARAVIILTRSLEKDFNKYTKLRKYPKNQNRHLPLAQYERSYEVPTCYAVYIIFNHTFRHASYRSYTIPQS